MPSSDAPGRLGAFDGARRENYAGETRVGVATAGLPATFRPGVQLREEDAEERRLQLVQARIDPDGLERALVPRAVRAQQADALCQLVVVGRHCARVAERGQVLRRIEAERRRMTEGAGRPPV